MYKRQAGIGLAVGAGMYVIGIAAMLLTLVGLEALSYIFNSVGMKSSMITLSTENKNILKLIADKFHSKDYRIVSYQMDTIGHGDCLVYTSRLNIHKYLSELLPISA